MSPKKRGLGASGLADNPFAGHVSAAFRWGWPAFILCLTVFPYLWAYATTPAGFHYSWILPPYPEDSFAYMAWSRQAQEGRWLFSLKYTALPHAPFVFQPFFLVCGKLAAWTGCEIGIVHLAMKSAGVVLFFWTFFKVLEHLRFDRLQAAAACVFVGLSSGWGALIRDLFGAAVPRDFFPIDLWLVDSNTFWSLLWNPLFPYALALSLWAFLLADRASLGAKSRDFWLAGLAIGVLGLIHPYETAVLWPLLILIIVVRMGRRAGPGLLRFAAASAPILACAAAIALFHPLLREHSARSQEGMHNPPLAACLIGFGLPLAFAALGVLRYRRAVALRYWPLLAWLALGFGLSRLPVWFQRKLLFGLHMPLCMLAGAAFGLIFGKLLSGPFKKFAAAIILLAAIPLAFYTPMRLFADAVGQRSQRPYRISREIMEGMAFLEKDSRPEDVVCASLTASLLIPAYAGNTVLWGHWAQSVDFAARQQWAHRVFDENSPLNDEERGREFWGLGIKYVFLDDRLREKFGVHSPAWLSSKAEKVFENPSVIIYRFNLSIQGVKRPRSFV